jgi:hypothetical protein
MSATQLNLFDVSEVKLKQQSLSEVLGFLNSIPNINKGGCGVSALALYRWSKQRESVSKRPFVFLYREDDALDADKNDSYFFNGDLDSAFVPAHIAVELFDGTYDSSGPDVLEWGLQQEYKLNESELIQILNKDGWNEWFRREKYIPVIEQELGIDLSDVNR